MPNNSKTTDDANEWIEFVRKLKRFGDTCTLDTEEVQDVADLIERQQHEIERLTEIIRVRHYEAINE